jgi:hypothetical protein
MSHSRQLGGPAALPETGASVALWSAVRPAPSGSERTFGPQIVRAAQSVTHILWRGAPSFFNAALTERHYWPAACTTAAVAIICAGTSAQNTGGGSHLSHFEIPLPLTLECIGALFRSRARRVRADRTCNQDSD